MKPKSKKNVQALMTNSFAWVYLTLAIFTEVMGTTSMKLSAGFSQLIPSICIFAFYGISLAFLAQSLKWLEVGFAYAIWSGLGTFLIFIIGVYFFQEPVTILRTLSLLCIITGVMGLKQI